MASWTMSSLLLVALCMILVNDVMAQWKFPLNDNEKEVCKQHENEDKEFDESKSYKHRRLGCKIHCAYKIKSTGEETEDTQNSPNGQLCCRIGILPTGKCVDGKCPFGNLIAF